MSAPWPPARAERHLRSLELFGMRFGLDRMRRLMTALGHPQERFGSIHVVGTNGKSSTTRMAAAILSAHGVRAGAYLSPHLLSFHERVLVGGREVDAGSFAAAVGRAARAAQLVDRTAPEDPVTQFELLTAAAYDELAAREVEVAVIEAGLGGRFDATNVIPSRVQVLTNVSLEHTRWLGPTVADIAREKLAVVRDGATLVVGELGGAAMDEARAAAARHGAGLVVAPAEPPVAPAAPGRYQRRNFALACSAVEAYLGALDPAAVREAAAAVTVPGRLQAIAGDPLTVVDGAHNPAGARALVESLPEVVEGRPVILVAAVLDDKDAAGMLRSLLPVCRAAVFTTCSNARALPAGTLESLARQIAGERAPRIELARDPARALATARELAGPAGAVLATGSIYLVADVLREADAAADRRAPAARERRGPP